MTKSKVVLASLLSLGRQILFNLLERCQSNDDDDDNDANNDGDDGNDDDDDDGDDSFTAMMVVLLTSLLSLGRPTLSLKDASPIIH